MMLKYCHYRAVYSPEIFFKVVVITINPLLRKYLARLGNEQLFLQLGKEKGQTSATQY